MNIYAINEFLALTLTYRNKKKGLTIFFYKNRDLDSVDHPRALKFEKILFCLGFLIVNCFHKSILTLHMIIFTDLFKFFLCAYRSSIENSSLE